jgi:CheY-like chemotaxis protein
MPAPEARPTVLVVDDDLGVLDLLRDLLESRGYHVLTALSGEDAVRAVAGQPVQAVVVDLFLPGMDGLQLITRLAPQLSPAAAIVITGYAHHPRLDAARRAGIGTVLRKPLDLDRLLASLQAILDEAGSSP